VRVFPLSKAVDCLKKTLTLSLSQSTGRGDQSGNGHMQLPRTFSHFEFSQLLFFTMVPKVCGKSTCGFCLASMAVIFLCLGSMALSPAQIALVVNQNSPDSLALAQAYAAARGIPAGRIISLNVPNAEEMEFDDYERNVVPPIREFLSTRGLQRQVRCLVTFYGVPFRIRAKVDTDPEKAELADLQSLYKKDVARLNEIITQEEKTAHSLDALFQPPLRVTREQESSWLTRRWEVALAVIGPAQQSIDDALQREQTTMATMNAIRTIGGMSEMVRRIRPLDFPATEPATQPASYDDRQRQRMQLRDRVVAQSALLQKGEEQRFDPAARALVRRISGQAFGLLGQAKVLESQIDYLNPATTNSALDNELSLLWLNYYPRNGNFVNALNYKEHFPLVIPAIMVSRLDAPDAATVARIIQTSVEVEKRGLTGCMALNSYGFPSHVPAGQPNEYKLFDEKIRDLGLTIKAHSGIQVIEEYTRLYRNHEVGQTALYCGWYSVRNYVPGMEFSPGAVAYHVASLEMVSLHGANEGGWVHGLLKDGVCATLGAVAEPYLGAFPPPNEFFPLLMTGKLTLAEVYWKTEPVSSWMIALIGDPLYTPYKMNPQMKVEDIPADLRAAIESGPGPVKPLKP